MVTVVANVPAPGEDAVFLPLVSANEPRPPAVEQATRVATPVIGKQVIIITVAPPILATTICVPMLTTIRLANLRSGPGMGYGIIATLLPDTAAPINAGSVDDQWWQITASGGMQGWVAASIVTPVCTADLPVVAVAPPIAAATLAPTPAPVNTATNTDTPPAATAPPAAVVSFVADNLTIEPGQCTTLHWDVSGAGSIIFTDGLGDNVVQSPSLRKVCPAKTSAYQLTVTGADGQRVQPQLVITVVGELPPVIAFTASNNPINAGQCTTLSWAVDGAQQVFFNDGSGQQAVTAHNMLRECPPGTDSYGLSAVMANGQSFQQFITVVVFPLATPIASAPGK